MKKNSNIIELITIKDEISSLNKEISNLEKKKQKCIDHLYVLSSKCNNDVMVKVVDSKSETQEAEFYCMLCGKKIKEETILDLDNLKIIDFSTLTYDRGFLSFKDKIEIAFDLFINIKQNNLSLTDMDVINIINDQIKNVDENIQNKVLRKLFDNL